MYFHYMLNKGVSQVYSSFGNLLTLRSNHDEHFTRDVMIPDGINVRHIRIFRQRNDYERLAKTMRTNRSDDMRSCQMRAMRKGPGRGKPIVFTTSHTIRRLLPPTTSAH